MNQLKAGIILNYVIIVLNIAVGLIYTPYMLQTMGQNEYGLYSLVASVISYLTVLDLGFGNAIIRYTSKFRAENKITEQYEMFGMFLILYCIIGLIAFGAGLGLYFNVDNLFGDTMSAYELDRARIMMLLLTFNLALTFPLSLFGSIASAYERFVFLKSLKIARILLSTIVMIGLLTWGYKAVAMVVVQTVFNISTLLIDFLYCKIKLKIKVIFGRFKWSFLKEVAIYSFWILLNVVMDRIYWSTGQFVLGAFVGTAAVAVFAVAIQLEQMYMTFSTSISSVFLPKVTGMVTLNNNKKEISDLFIRTGRLQYIVMSTILFGFIIFGKQFIALWAGYEYDEAYYITLMFFVSLFPPLIQNLGITILQARNQMKFRSLLYIVIATVSLILQIFLSKLYGGLGCAMAISGALLIGQGLIMNIYYHKRQGINIIAFWKEIIKMSASPIVISLICIFLMKDIQISSWMSLTKYIAIFISLYIPTFYICSCNAYEKQLIKSLLNTVIKRFKL